MELTFGKHKGEDIENIPESYLEWGVEKLESPKWRSLFQDELNRRGKIEAEFRQQIANDPENPKLIKQLKNRFWKEYEEEVANSGEYDYCNPTPEIEEKIKGYILVATTEKQIEELKAEYASLVGGIKIVEKILSSWINDDFELNPERFSTPEKFKIAQEFIEKYDQLATSEYYEASF